MFYPLKDDLLLLLSPIDEDHLSLSSKSLSPVGTPTIPPSFLYAADAISIVCFIASSNLTRDELKDPFSAKSNNNFSEFSIIF